jgi:hypothetical protein
VDMRARVVLLAVMASVCLYGCNGERMPAATPTEALRVGPGGPILRPLVSGRQVLAPDGRYALFVPADWIEVPSGVAEVTYQSPDPVDTLTVSIAREQLSETRRAQSYAEAGRRSVSAVWSNVITLTMAPVQVGEVSAYRWVYTASIGNVERLVYQLYIVEGSEGFVLTGFAPRDADIDAAQAVFDAIGGSISFGVGALPHRQAHQSSLPGPGRAG